MKSIVQFIKQNLDGFNNETPAAGHFERFTSKLDIHLTNRKRALRYQLMRIAALVLFVLLVSAFFFREYRMWDENSSDFQLISYNLELAEADRYYTDQSGIYYKKIEELKFLNNASEKRQVLQELRQMDKQVEQMKEDLMQYPDNELIVNAIINYYQIKLELMDNIIVRIQNMNSTLL